MALRAVCWWGFAHVTRLASIALFGLLNSLSPRSPYRSTAAQAARVIAPAGEEVIDGIGVGASLVARIESAPGGFEENYGLMFEALIDAGDACADPKAVVAAWDESPPDITNEDSVGLLALSRQRH